MKRPWLIQRCELQNGTLRYVYMGNTEFEVGDQAKSLGRVFATGIALGSTRVIVQGKEIPVHIVASKGFSFADYQPYLQQLAEGKLQLKQWTNFDRAVKEMAGITTGRQNLIEQVNVWFDFQNDVLWTLTLSDQKALVDVLEGIKKKWAEKK